MRCAVDAAYEAWDAFKPTQQDVSGHGAMEAALLAAISAMSGSIVAAISANVQVCDGQTVINGPGALADILSAISDDTQVGIGAADEPSPTENVEALREKVAVAFLTGATAGILSIVTLEDTEQASQRLGEEAKTYAIAALQPMGGK